MRNAFFIIGLLLILISCAPSPQTALPQKTSNGLIQPTPTLIVATPTKEIKPFILSSPVLEAEQMIPSFYSCHGKDISIPLEWGDPPEGTQSFSLIMDDPDARAVAGYVWIHWVIFNIPPSTRTLTENMPTSNTLPDGSIQGKNSFGKIGYGGPCPPSGMHHYHFKLYALDIMLDAAPGATSGVITQKMKGHILAQTELITTYRKH